MTESRSGSDVSGGTGTIALPLSFPRSFYDTLQFPNSMNNNNNNEK
eukprot:UN08759